MPMLLSFVLRVVVVAAGLVFAGSLAVAFAVLYSLWCVRAAWASVTGRPVTPFIMRVPPGAGFQHVYRRAGQRSRTPRADAVRPHRAMDVTDVEPR